MVERDLIISIVDIRRCFVMFLQVVVNLPDSRHFVSGDLAGYTSVQYRKIHRFIETIKHRSHRP